LCEISLQKLARGGIHSRQISRIFPRFLFEDEGLFPHLPMAIQSSGENIDNLSQLLVISSIHSDIGSKS
jgi:hypothetical protein